MPNLHNEQPVSLADLPDDHPIFRGGRNQMMIRNRDIIRARRAQGLPDYPERPQPQEQEQEP